MKKVFKQPGWKGKKNDLYWTKDSAYGVRYKCSFCGKEKLGMSTSQTSEAMHTKECPWRLKKLEKENI
jgi:hypothetical protein